MRALVLEDWWKLVVAQRPDPTLGGSDVVIKIVATGICGSDLHGYTGENGRRQHGQVMGHETAGRIMAIGPDVDPSLGLNLEDVVTVNPVIGCGTCDQCLDNETQACKNKTVIGVTPERVSAFAELLVAPAANVVPLPAGIPVEYGALVEPLAVGYHAVRRSPIGPGERTLVIGGGPIGQACVLAATREGARRVALSEPDAARRQASSRLGAATLDPTEGDMPRRVSAALDGTADVVIDAVGSNQSLRDGLACAPIQAHIVLVGMATPDLSMQAYEISTKERSIIGSFCYSPAEFADTAHWVGTEPDGVAHLVDGRVALAEAPTAFQRLARGEWGASKVLVHFDDL